MIYEAQRTDFIEILAKNDMAIFFFYPEKDKSSTIVKKVKTLVKDYISENPNVNVHFFMTDKDEKTKLFSQVLELDSIVPTMVVYKQGQFNRYLNKEFTTTSIKKFLASGKKKSQSAEVEM